MSETIEKRLERVEAELAELKQRLEAIEVARYKDWRRTVGMSANDPGFDEMVRLGREDRQSLRVEDVYHVDG